MKMFKIATRKNMRRLLLEKIKENSIITKTNSFEKTKKPFYIKKVFPILIENFFRINIGKKKISLKKPLRKKFRNTVVKKNSF
jgi:hypothetical protein